MRRPSSRILVNTVDVTPCVPGIDADSAPQFSYPGPPIYYGQRCSVQYTGTEEVVDEFNRLVVVNRYDVIFDFNPKLKPLDLIVQRDTNPNRTLYVRSSPPSEAGRDSAWLVRCIEKI